MDKLRTWRAAPDHGSNVVEVCALDDYRELEAEVAVAKANFDEIRKLGEQLSLLQNHFHAQVELAKAETQRLREALEHYESSHYDASGRPCSHDKTASEALKPSAGSRESVDVEPPEELGAQNELSNFKLSDRYGSQS